MRRRRARTKGRRRKRAQTKEDGGGGELGRRSTEAARSGGGLAPVAGGRRTGGVPSAVSPSALCRESERTRILSPTSGLMDCSPGEKGRKGAVSLPPWQPNGDLKQPGASFTRGPPARGKGRDPPGIPCYQTSPYLGL